ncbi:MAG: hypothetical protein JXB45_10335 [Candidatus Krumholzibacteriota bacterium]|nr:hypothetical protein [Candidatus Krumholzibacteriota bacterium]
MDNVRKYLPSEEEQKIDLNIYWKVFWRKKFYLIIPVVLGLIISVIGVRYLTPIYEASTLISVEDNNILSPTMQRYITPVEERERSRSRQFRAMIEAKLKNRDFLELIIQDFDLLNKSFQTIPAAKQPQSQSGISREERMTRRLVSILRGKIDIETTMPGFYRISVFDPNPSTAFQLASKIHDKYIEVTQQDKIQGIRQAGAFSDEQLAIFKEKLETSEKELSRVKRELAETDVETNPVNAVNLHVAEARKRTLSTQVERNSIALNQVRSRLTEILELVPSTSRIASDVTITNIDEQLAARSDELLLGELAGEVQQTEENRPANELWEELRRRIAEIINDEYDEFSSDLRPLITEYYYQRFLVDHFKARENKLLSYIDQFKENRRRRPQLEREENRLNREVETNRSIYEAFLQSKTSAQITEAVQSTNLGVRITTVEKAEKPFTPVKPNKIKIILLALIFGFACGGGAILITEYMDDSFRSVEEVQRILKVPVLGTIPKTISHFAWEKKKRGRMILLWIIGIFIFISMMSGALYFYAMSLRGSSIGVELTEE